MEIGIDEVGANVNPFSELAGIVEDAQFPKEIWVRDSKFSIPYLKRFETAEDFYQYYQSLNSDHQ
jgi:hypothetical protein